MSGKPNVMIVEARFYGDIAEELANGAIRVIENAGLAHERVQVPGVFEIPAAVRFAIRAMEMHSAPARYAGFVALGCVIRGETDHYEHICREASRALMELTVTYSIALGFGILTCDTREQARARAAAGEGNKGAVAAEACLAMMDLKKFLRLVPG